MARKITANVGACGQPAGPPTPSPARIRPATATRGPCVVRPVSRAHAPSGRPVHDSSATPHPNEYHRVRILALHQLIPLYLTSAGRAAMRVRPDHGAELPNQQRGNSRSPQPAGCLVITLSTRSVPTRRRPNEEPKSFQAPRRVPGFASERRCRPAISPPAAIDIPPMTYISTDIAAPANDFNAAEFYGMDDVRPGAC